MTSRLPGAVPVPLLYVVGTGRSGSTLLEQLLDDRAGYVGLGELMYIWLRGCRYNERCSCGQPFAECPFWQGVLETTFGDRGSVPVDRLLASQQYLLRMRNIPLFNAPAAQSSEFRGHVDFLHEVYARLYYSIQRQEGAQVLVDSSKYPPFGHLLLTNPWLDVQVVHMVRDPRAVAFSWQRRRRRPEANKINLYMPVFSPSTSARIWLQDNLFSAGLRRKVDDAQLLRYEDLAVDPDLLEPLLARLRLPCGQRIRPDAAPIRHSVSGNPSRMDSGPARISLDEAWKSEMSRKDRMLVTTLTAPALVHYGYRLAS